MSQVVALLSMLVTVGTQLVGILSFGCGLGFVAFITRGWN